MSRRYPVAEIRKFLWMFDAGRHVGDTEGYRRGHVDGFDAGVARGRELERKDFSASIDAANREIARELPRALDAQAYRRKLGVAS